MYHFFSLQYHIASHRTTPPHTVQFNFSFDCMCLNVNFDCLPFNAFTESAVTLRNYEWLIIKWFSIQRAAPFDGYVNNMSSRRIVSSLWKFHELISPKIPIELYRWKALEVQFNHNVKLKNSSIVAVVRLAYTWI